MKALARRRLCMLPLGLAISALTSTRVLAQAMPNVVPGAGNIATGRRSQGPAGGAEKAPLPAPDAIPGAKAREPAAPATRAASDMQPTEALFDSINRGDIAAARDALNRGADLNGTNVLGMTPMDLSVDLGRNDISFLLLSMRGEDSSRGSRAAAGASAVATPPQKLVHSRTPAVPTKLARTEPARQTVSRPVATPKLFANDGGTPLPSAGFLGFGTKTN